MLILILFWPPELLAQSGQNRTNTEGILLAQKGNAKKQPAPKRGNTAPSRNKILTKEKVTSGTSTNLDFDATDIGGMRKTPLGTLVNQTKADMGYDFVKIRTEWHNEMSQSAASLEADAR
jgi:hypothetical protein